MSTPLDEIRGLLDFATAELAATSSEDERRALRKLIWSLTGNLGDILASGANLAAPLGN